MKIKNLPDRLIWAAIIAYAAFFSYLSLLKYNNYIYNDFDLAIDAQVLWNIIHGSCYSSIHQIIFLGNHMRLILFLIAPLYAIFTSPVLLLVMQSAFLGLAAYPLYKLTKDILDYKFALAMAISYLLYPALMYMNLFEFHPTALATCFLMFMLYYFYQDKFRAFIVFAALALICQENIALLLVTTGIFALFVKKEKKWFAAPAAIGAVYFYISVFKVIPYFNNGTIEFGSLYSRLGPDICQAAANIFLNPFKTIGIMLLPENIFLLFGLFAPLIFLPLLYMPLLLVGAPVFLQHMLSSRFMEHTIFYHYSAELIPFIFVAAAYGIKRLVSVFGKPIDRRALLWLVVIAAVVSSAHMGPLGRISESMEAWKARRGASARIDGFIKQIPPAAAVAATFEFLPKLSNREYLYSFHHFYAGRPTLSEKSFKSPQTIGYALINYDDRHTFEDFRGLESGENLKDFFAKYNLEKIGGFDKVEFYKRRVNDEK